MVTLLISSILILGLVVVAVYFWQKPTSTPDLNELPPPAQPRSLFTNPETHQKLGTTVEPRASLIERAKTGDKSSLQEARDLKDEDIYDEVLTALVKSTTSDAQLLSLTSHIMRNEWPVNKTLAAACIDSWQKAPDQTSTTKTLHITAMSDDADTYRIAAERAMQFWREGKIPGLTAIELNALLNGEFWVLSSATRSSGAGFILKRSLASARRELEGTTTNN